MLLSNSLAVQRVAVDTLTPSAPVRRHPKKQLAKILRSLEVFGQVTPILVTPGCEIIDLELVWHALKLSGATHVDVIVVTDRSPEGIAALRLVLNRAALDAVWDDKNLRVVLQNWLDVNFDLDITGFETPEIDNYLNLDAPQANVEENGSDIPLVGATAISAPGMIWALEDHPVGCGSDGLVRRVLNGRTANVCFVDPPYNFKVDGFISGKGSHRHRDGRICCGVELDPLYVDVTVRRWQNATGRDAVLTDTGEHFNNVARRRLVALSEPNHGA